MTAVLMQTLPVTDRALERHRAATERLAAARERTADLAKRSAAIEALGADLTALGATVRLVVETAAELLPEAIAAGQGAHLEAERLRAVARNDLLPQGMAQEGSRLWNVRAETVAANERFNTARSTLQSEGERLGSLKRRLAAGAISNGAELAAIRADIELGEPRLRAAEAAAAAAEAAWQAAKAAETDLEERIGRLRRTVAQTDDCDAAETAAAEIWALLTRTAA